MPNNINNNGPRIPPRNTEGTQQSQTTQQTQTTQEVAETAPVANQQPVDQLQTGMKPTPALTGSNLQTDATHGSQRSSDPRLALLDAQSAIPTVGNSRSDPTTPGLDINRPDIIGDANEVLNLDAMNATYNPFKEYIGDYTEPGQAFQSKVMWPTQKVTAGLFMQAIPGLPDDNGGPLSKLKELAGSLQGVEVIPEQLQGAADQATQLVGGDTDPAALQESLQAILGGLGIEGEGAQMLAAGMIQSQQAGQANAGDVLLGALREQGKLPEIPLFVAAMQENSVTFSAAHQFRLPNGELGNNVVLYGTNAAHPTEGHSGIDAVAHEVAKTGGRLLKVMSHIDKAGQGGTPDKVVSGGVSGVTHTGGYSAGFLNGEPVSIASDFPSNYGRMDNGNRTYNAVLMKVDFQAGTNKEVPTENLHAFKQNADMIDVFASIIPFASGDRDSRFKNYTYNALEVHDRESAVSFGKALFTLDKDHVLQQHGAFYCAEGQYAINGMGSQGQLLLKKSKFADTNAGKLIDAFQRVAAELEGSTVTIPDNDNPGQTKDVVVEDAKMFPNLVWERLKDVPEEEGGISEKMYDGLNKTKRTSAWLEWIPEDAKGLEAFDPIHPEGMIAETQTIATMAWRILKSTMPIDKMGGTIAQQMVDMYSRELPAGASDEQKAQQAMIKSQIGQFLGDVSMNPINAQIMGEASANLMMLNIIENSDFEKTMLDKSGFKEITEGADTNGDGVSDKDEYKAIYQEYIGGMKKLAMEAAVTGLTLAQTPGASVADYTKATSDSRDAFLEAMDDKFRNLEVSRDLRVYVDGEPQRDAAGNEIYGDDGNPLWVEGKEPRDELIGTKTAPFLYAAPATNLFNAQDADSHKSMIRYVAYAMHVDQATSPDFEDRWKDNFLPLADELSSLRYEVAVDDSDLYVNAREPMREVLLANRSLFEDNGVELTDDLIERSITEMTRTDGAVAAGARLEAVISPLLVAAQDQ